MKVKRCDWKHFFGAAKSITETMAKALDEAG